MNHLGLYRDGRMSGLGQAPARGWRKPTGDGQRGEGARRRLRISLRMFSVPSGLMRPGLYPPVPPLLGQGKGRKALHTHCGSILCQRSGIRRAAGREVGGRRQASAAGLRACWGLSRLGEPWGAGGHRSSPRGHSFAKG